MCCRFPWDWRCPLGYFAAICLQCSWLHLIMLMFCCEVSLFVRYVNLLGALAKDLSENMIEFIETHNKFDQSNINQNVNRAKVKIIQIVAFHVTTKQWVVKWHNNFNLRISFLIPKCNFGTRLVSDCLDIYRLQLTAYFYTAALILCTCLLGVNAVNASIHELNVTNTFNISSFLQTLFIEMVESIQYLVCLIICLIAIGLLCLVGQEMTTNFDEMHANIFIYWNWYEFPLEIQKIIRMMLLSSENAVCIEGFMGVKCTREFMKSVS